MIISAYINVFLCFISIFISKTVVSIHVLEMENEESQKNITNFFKDLIFGLQMNSLVIVNSQKNYSINNTLPTSDYIENLNSRGVSVIMFSVNGANDSYYRYLKNAIENYIDVTTIFICQNVNCEEIVNNIKSEQFIRRRLIYIFYWGDIEIGENFTNSIHEAMRVVIVTNPKRGLYRLFYNQASPGNKQQALIKVNWWSSGRLYRYPPLPSSKKIFDNFEGRVFKIPVLHVPPWHFVSYNNVTTIKVMGGRDHQLLQLLANKLNFKYDYFDPPEHSQGSGISANGSFKGVLGMIYRREADFFLGDVSVTWERLAGVEFSFFILADSGAFLTRAPRPLSEALALLRPFTWEVWPAVLACVIVSGPALWVTAAGAALWRPRRAPTPKLSKCIWFTTSIFLRQSGRLPSEKLRARALTLLLSLAATYVLCDVYSATLTSLLARPAREPPLTDLFALERAMKHNGYTLYVERHSSSLTILRNGTGVYGRLWDMMRHQPSHLVYSVEQGVRRMLQSTEKSMVLLAGRETLYFDKRRFGASNFQLSEKLYTRYSSIAFQLGCPYIENFNRVLMQLFEAGILTKITSEEYEKLGDFGADGNKVPSSTNSDMDTGSSKDNKKSKSSNASHSTQKLEPINMRMLQGAFYVLIFGYVLSGITLIVEIQTNKRFGSKNKAKFRIPTFAKNISIAIEKGFRSALRLLRRRWTIIKAPSELSLDYIE